MHIVTQIDMIYKMDSCLLDTIPKYLKLWNAHACIGYIDYEDVGDWPQDENEMKILKEVFG